MSLIHDAQKMAQRERARASAKSQQAVAEGFFPYVSGSPSRAKSHRLPALVIGGAVVLLLGVTAWLMLLSPAKAPQATSTPPIILPPPVTVSQAPVVDSAVVTPPDSQAAAVQPEERSPAATPSDARTSASTSGTARRRVSAGTTLPLADQPRNADSTRRIEPVTTSPPARVEPIATRIDYEMQATALFNAGDLAGARDKFQLATRFAPTARAWTNYGVTLQRLGDLGGASAAYQAAIGIDAGYLEAWLYQGRLAMEQGDVARAIPLFQRARSINARNADVNVELASLEYSAKNYSESKRFAEEAIRGDATNFRAHWYLGASSDALKDADGAIRGYSGFLQYVGDAQREQAQFVGYARMRLEQLKGKP